MYRKGTRVRGKGFALVIMQNSLSYNRLGVSIHRHVRGTVQRNRIKRIIKESFRLRREIFPQSCDIVFTVRPNFSLNGPASIMAAVMNLKMPRFKVEN